MKNNLNFSVNIGVIGKPNVGKTSLIKAIMEQNQNNPDLFPLSNVKWLDNDMKNIDVAILVIDYKGLGHEDFATIDCLKKQNTPFMVVINKFDEQQISSIEYNDIVEYTEAIIETSCLTDYNLKEKITEELINILPTDILDQNELNINRINTSDLIIVVTEKIYEGNNNIVIPQAFVIQKLLEKYSTIVVKNVKEMDQLLKTSNINPKLVVLPSKDAIETKNIPTSLQTSYSAIISKLKGNLSYFTQNAETIKKLKKSDKILVITSTHNIKEEQEYVKNTVPDILEKKLKCKLNFEYHTTHNINNLYEYKLILQSEYGMESSKNMLCRIHEMYKREIPFSTCGLIITACAGLNDGITQFYN